MYALIENGTVVRYPYSILDLKKDNPNTSFSDPISDESLIEFGVEIVYTTSQPPCTQYQYVEETTPVFNTEDKRWEQAWEIVNKTPEQIAAEEEAQRQANKAQAESLLQATDWTATVDINNPQYSNPYLVNQADFLAYRSNVRMIAVNPPVVVDVWPVKPDEQWSTT